jgi:hypothetical protein
METRQSNRVVECDQSTLFTCVKCNNETPYFVQFIYTNKNGTRNTVFVLEGKNKIRGFVEQYVENGK